MTNDDILNIVNGFYTIKLANNKIGYISSKYIRPI